MGFFDAIFGGGSLETKIDKLKKKKKVREIAAYTNVDDPAVKQKAYDALYELAESGNLAREYEEAVIDLIDPVTHIIEKRKINKIDDPLELRKMAVSNYIPKRECDLAIFALERALEKKPNDNNLLNNLAAAHSLNNDFETAQEIWEKILKNDPNDQSAKDNYTTSLHLQASKILKKKPDSEKALGFLTRALEINPAHINSMKEIADYYLNNQKYEKALYYYKQCLHNAKAPAGFMSVTEFRGQVYQDMAECHRAAGDPEEAKANYEQALVVHHWDDDARVLIKNKLEKLK